MEINPITQRCITISKEHSFEPMLKPSHWSDYTTGEIHGNLIAVHIKGKNAYKCVACGMVDDLYEGRYT